MNAHLQIRDQVVIERAGLQGLLEALTANGYRLVGPRVRDGAIIYDKLSSIDDLPAGRTDEQEGAKYRLRKRADGALFGYAVGPHSWKKFLFPPVTRLWSAKRTGGSFALAPEQEEAPRYAFIGVRSCELHAIATQDKVFMGGKFVDSVYKARKGGCVHCRGELQPGWRHLFLCVDEDRAKGANRFDLALTEIVEDGQHYFVVEIGTEKGAEILTQIAHHRAGVQEQRAAGQVVERTAGQMGRTMDTTDIKELLYRNYEHPRWDHIFRRICTLIVKGSYFTRPGAYGMPPDYSFTHEAGVKLPHLTRYSIDHLVNRAIHIVAFGTGFDCDMITATQNHFSS